MKATGKIIVLALIIVMLAMIAYLVVRLNQKEGFVVYLDGLSASGKTSLSQELLKHPEYKFIFLSTDECFKQTAGNYFKCSNDLYNGAQKLALNGSNVILDSFITEKAAKDRISHPNSYIILVGLWCDLDCLKSRFDQRAGKVDAHKKSNLVEGYKERYPNRSAAEIRDSKGSFLHENVLVQYDMFFDSENMSAKDMAQKILAHASASNK